MQSYPISHSRTIQLNKKWLAWLQSYSRIGCTDNAGCHVTTWMRRWQYEHQYSYRTRGRSKAARMLANQPATTILRRSLQCQWRAVSYKAGDRVLVWTPIRIHGLSEKLLRWYFGPYRVLQKLSDVTYEVVFDSRSCVRSWQQRPELVHVARMKPYVSDWLCVFTQR